MLESEGNHSDLGAGAIKNIRTSRMAGFAVIFLVYLAAAVIGLVVFYWSDSDKLMLAILYSDLAATLFVWFMGVVLRNSSIYDPYWSVAPILIVLLLVKAWNIGALLLTAVILIWGVRLTAHWAVTFRNLDTQDWRYDQFKEARPKAWFVTNLFGINLFPTLIVYLVTIPADLFLLHFAKMNAGILAGACLSLFAVTVQAVSDRQMTRFRSQRENRGRIIQTGLWKSIRHPNYLGEILMWWGVYVMLLSASPKLWFTLAGAAANTLMFIFVSIPLMEKRQLQSKPDYAAYRTQTGMLLPKLKMRTKAL